MQQRTRLDSLFGLLADSTRRDVIARLHEKEEVTVGVSEQRRRVEMVHTHLPKLADHKIIEYEQVGNVVRVKRGTRWGDMGNVVKSLSETGVLKD